MLIETTATEVITPAAPVDATAPAAAPASAATPEAGVTDTSNTEQANDEGSTQQEEQDRNDKGQYRSGVQKRIDDLTFRRNQAEREAAHWKSVAESRQAAAAPKPSDYASDDEYDAAVLDHRIESGIDRGLAKTAQQQADKFAQEAQSAAAETYEQRVSEVKTRIPDWADVVGKAVDVGMSRALHEALMDSDKGPDLVYHLAKNPSEAERLNSMSVRQMDREIGRLELTIGTKAAPTPPAARTTNAPPPVRPGSQASAPANTDPNNMPQAEFEAWAKASGSKFIR